MKKSLVTLSAIVGALVLSGCGATDSESGAEAANSSFGQCDITSTAGEFTLDTEVDGVLTVATVLPNPGWWNGTSPESTDNGYEYCMAADIANRAGLKSVKVKNLAWDQYISGTAKGYDVAIASTTITEEREKVFDFSDPYFSSDLGVAVGKDADVTAENLRSKTIGVLQGNQGADYVATTLKPESAPRVFQSQNDMFTALSAGQVDAVVTDTTLALANVKQSNGAMAVVGQLKLDQGYGVVLPEGSEHLAVVNQMVAAQQADGTLEQLAEEYLTPQFGTDPSTVPYWDVK
jgi:polar amino acid transport system substrate-binding protein